MDPSDVVFSRNDHVGPTQEMSNTHFSDSDFSDGDFSDGDFSDGDISDGDISDGDISDGDFSDGDFSLRSVAKYGPPKVRAHTFRGSVAY